MLIALIVSGLLLWLALRGLDWSATVETLQQAKWAYLPLIFAGWALGLAARALRWWLLLDRQVGFGTAFHIHNIGLMVNSVIPLRGGELLRAFLVERRQPELPFLTVLSTIVTERLLDILAIVLLLVLALPALPLDPALVSGGWLVGAAALAGFAVMLFFAHRRDAATSLLKLILRLLPVLGRIDPAGLLEKVLDGLRPLTTRRGLLGALLSSLLAAAALVIEVWALALIFEGLPLSDGLIRAGLVFAAVAASLSIIVPLTFAGAGPFEAAVIFALTTAGVSADTAAAFAILWHVGIILNTAFWCAVGLLMMNVSIRQLGRDFGRLAGGA